MFDRGRELPVATVRRAPASTIGQALGGLQQWLADRWAFLRPRALPVLVAIASMFAVLGAANYLAQPPASAIELTDQPNTDTPPPYSFHIKLVIRQ